MTGATKTLTTLLLPLVLSIGCADTGFDGTDAAGTWSLYVLDWFAPDFGAIAGGFSLDITYSEAMPTAIPTLSTLGLAVLGLLLGVIALALLRR